MNFLKKMQLGVEQIEDMVEETLKRKMETGDLKPEPGKPAYEPVGFNSSEDLNKENMKVYLQLMEEMNKKVFM